MHFYVGFDVLPYLRYCCIDSFSRLNPDWQVMLWRGSTVYNEPWSWSTHEQKLRSYQGPDYLSKLGNIETVNFNEIGFREQANENFKSDWLRLWCLNRFGGYYADCDILFVKPMFDDLLEYDFAIPYEAVGDYFSTAFLGSLPNNPILVDLASKAMELWNPESYQSAGTDLFRKVIGGWQGLYKYNLNCWNMPIAISAPVKFNQTYRLWIDNDASFIQPYSVGVHLFSGDEYTCRFESVLYSDEDLTQYDNWVCSHLRATR